MKLAASADGGSHHRVIFPKLLRSVVAGDHKIFVKEYNSGPLDLSIGYGELIGPYLKEMPKDMSVEVVKDDSFLTLISIPPSG